MSFLPPARHSPPPASTPQGSCTPIRSAHWLAVALCCASFIASPGSATEKKTSAPSKADVAEKRSDLKELREQIDSLRKEMAAAEDKRASAADQLKEMERDISVTQRELHGLAGQRSKLQLTLKELGGQARELESRLDHLHAQLEQLVYRQYLQGNPDTLHLLLNGEDPNQLARDLYYLGEIGKARSQILKETAVLLERKKSLAADIRERAEVERLKRLPDLVCDK